MRTIRLVFVSKDNHNKYYDMSENTDGTFTATWGRIGVTSETQTYPIKRWNSKYKEKLKKGYTDQSHLFLKKTNTNTLANISDKDINDLVQLLQQFANTSVSNNYTVDAKSVTQVQVDAAQLVIDELSKTVNKRSLNHEDINEYLVQLYGIIPRRMANVKHHLCNENNTKDTLKQLLTTEQETLDVMAGQVTNNALQDITTDKNILELMGIELELAKDAEIRRVAKYMDIDRNRLISVYKVCMHKTEGPYAKNLQESKNKTTELYWHGSRNENWWSILQSGLMIRPSNAIITGKMFGYGLYGADAFRKSYGYTSGDGSYWARGQQPVALLGLFEFHMGNTLKVTNHDSSHNSLTYEKLQKLGDYDSLSALRGISLLNNEFIVYRENQVTAKYLVKVKA
jgi:poly [ADP-ribose] polymerase 2/3/4